MFSRRLSCRCWPGSCFGYGSGFILLGQMLRGRCECFWGLTRSLQSVPMCFAKSCASRFGPFAHYGSKNRQGGLFLCMKPRTLVTEGGEREGASLAGGVGNLPRDRNRKLSLPCPHKPVVPSGEYVTCVGGFYVSVRENWGSRFRPPFFAQIARGYLLRFEALRRDWWAASYPSFQQSRYRHHLGRKSAIPSFCQFYQFRRDRS